MAKTYRPYLPEQDLLLPPSPRDWLPEDHLAYFVSDIVDQLDLTAITAVYEAEDRGFPPYHPVMMTKVLVYAYCVGVFSSRRIQRRLLEDIAFRMLAAGNTPDFRTIAEFRRIHLPALSGLFEQVLRLARELGAPRLGRVALDGSKVKANASKHKAMSYDRMREKQRQLRAEVTQLLAQAEAADAAEDAENGAGRRGDDLPAELHRRESRLARIREAKRASRPAPKRRPPPPAPPRTRRAGSEGAIQLHRSRVPDHEGPGWVRPGVQRPDRGGRTATDRRPGGDPGDQRQEATAADDHDHRAAIGRDAEPTARRRRLLLGRERHRPRDHADRRLYLDAEAEARRATGAVPARAAAVDRDHVDRMTRKLHTKVGAAVYAARKAIVEPVFGQIKHGRGFRQFLLRGIDKVRGEWSLVCTTHNLLKLYRLCV